MDVTMYERFMKQWNAKYRLLTGLVLFLVGLIIQMISKKTLDMYAFYMMAAAVLCVANVLIQKMAKAEADFIRYLLLNMLVVIIGFALVGADLISGVVMYTVLAICVVVDWIINTILLKCDDLLKRIVMGFVAMLLNVVFMAIVFMVPVLFAAFN